MTARTLGAALLFTALATGHHAHADAVKLPGACIKPVHAPSGDGTPGTPKSAAPLDLDGDGKPDAILANHDSCDGRGNCVWRAFVMRGACGYLVGFGADAFQEDLTVLPEMHHGLHDLSASFLAISEQSSLKLTFNGTTYVAEMVDSAPRGGVGPSPDDQARTDAAYKAAMTRARKLDDAGDHVGAIAAFEVALAADTAHGGSLTDDQTAQAKLELGAAALGAKQLDRAEQATRDGLFTLHATNEASHTKLLAMGWFNLGAIAQARGDTTVALDAYQQSVHDNPAKAVVQRLAAVTATVLTTTVDGAGLPALSADGATLALLLGGKVAFVPTGAGFDASHAIALSPSTLDDINARLTTGRFRTITSRRLKDGDAETHIASLGIGVRLGPTKPTGRSLWCGMDGLELQVRPNESVSLGTVPETVKSPTAIAIVRAPRTAFLYLELGGRTLQVVPLTLPAFAKQ